MNTWSQQGLSFDCWVSCLLPGPPGRRHALWLLVEASSGFFTGAAVFVLRPPRSRPRLGRCVFYAFLEVSVLWGPLERYDSASVEIHQKGPRNKPDFLSSSSSRPMYLRTSSYSLFAAGTVDGQGGIMTHSRKHGIKWNHFLRE